MKTNFRKCVLFVLILLMGSTSFCLAGEASDKTKKAIPGISYEQLTKNIPKSHPRVYINEDDIAVLRKKTKDTQFKKTWEDIIELDHPLARAFEALINSDEEMAKHAAIEYLTTLQECTSARIPFNEMQIGACIYDWCYYQMDNSLRQAYVNEFERIAASHSPFYPAKTGYGALVGHNCEGWLLSDQLPAGLAMYDEDPVMYDSATAVFVKEFVPARNFFFQSHMHHQGDSYFGTRFIHEATVAWFFKKLGHKVFIDDLKYVPYQLVYNYRPDGQQMRSGDTFDDGGDDSGGRARSTNRKAMSVGLIGWMFDDPYLQSMYYQYKTGWIEKIFEFIFKPLNENPGSIEELPTTKYFPQPMGEMIARTNWDMGVNSNAAIIQMRIGNYFFGNHQTKDFGTFQIYYKGALAISSGIYEGNGQGYGKSHWLNYHHQTISKNGLLIFDPNETIYNGSVNDGGQRWPNKGDDHPKTLEILLDKDNGYKMGEVTGLKFGPDKLKPEYSFIEGDITAAYDSGKVESVKRSMLTLNTGDTVFPALFFVFDRIISKRPDFKKTWLLHSIQEPQIADKTTIIKRTGPVHNHMENYNGKLISKTIFPENAEIKKVGGPGKEFWIASTATNYYSEKDNPATEGGAWRIEVSPKKKNKKDVFFHAMAVTQASSDESIDFTRIDSDLMVGVYALGRGAIFSKKDQKQTNLYFDLKEALSSLFIADLLPGNWIVKRDGDILNKIKVTEGEGCLYLEVCKPGQYELVLHDKH